MFSHRAVLLKVYKGILFRLAVDHDIALFSNENTYTYMEPVSVILVRKFRNQTTRKDVINACAF